jgi:hypothetical protein
MRNLLFISALLISTNAFSLQSSVDRRAFVSTAALLIATPPAVAIDDLAMPTDEEARLSEEVGWIVLS